MRRNGPARTESWRRRPGVRRARPDSRRDARSHGEPRSRDGAILGAGRHAGKRAYMPERARYSFWFTAMGILDDAIREHLELIRQRGAADSEVQRLEDEAFGPPTRPDEADFPKAEQGVGSGNGVATEAAVEEPENAAAYEDVTTLLPAEEAIEAEETPGT